MSHGKTTEDARCELRQFERNRYFYGKLMTVRDFEAEQRFIQGHRYLHNQSLHGWGVVCGLTVEVKGGIGNEKQIVVKPGIALDCCGRELVLAKDVTVDLADFQTRIGTVDATTKNVYLCIKYDECDREPVPALANVSTCEEVCEYNRIQEKVAFDILTSLPPSTPSTDPCETWLNLTSVKSEINDGEQVIAEFERLTPRWVRQGEVFEVRRRIKPTQLGSGRTFQVLDALPEQPANGFVLIEGSLSVTETDADEGRVIQSSYFVKVANTVAPGQYQITGQALQSPPDVLASSSIGVIPETRPLEEQIRERLFNERFAECPRCAEDLSNQCIVLASITLQPQNSSFSVSSINNVTFDATNGIYRRLVYDTSLVVELLNCLRKQGLSQVSLLAAAGPGLNVSTGLVRFEDVLPGSLSESEPIPHGLDTNLVSINMALVDERFRDNTFILMGDLQSFIATFPALAAGYDPEDNTRTFRIALLDNRPPTAERRVTWMVRWWAIPKSMDRPDVRVRPRGGGIAPPVRFGGLSRNLLLMQLRTQPGLTDRELASVLRIDPQELRPVLEEMVRARELRVTEGRFSLETERVPPP